ncbi:MAG: ABC transporter ATP-binding protein [Pseudomonadota bacterium]
MSDIKVLQKYHRLLRPYLGTFLIAILFDIGMTLLGLTTPLFTRALFDYAYPYRDLTLLNTTIVAIVVVYFLYFFLSVASDYLQIYIHQEANANLTEKVFHAIQCLPLKFHLSKKTGDLMIRITDDVAKTVGMVTNVLPIIIIDGGRFFVILAISLFINVELTLLALVSIPLYILEARFYAGRIADIEGQSIAVESDIYSRAQEKLSSIKTIKAFGQERNETLSFGGLIRRRYKVAVKGRLLNVIQTFTNSITLQMWSVFLTWYLGYQVVRGTLSIGEIVALMLYIDQLGDPVRSFINLFTQWKTNLVSMRRLDEILEQPTEETQDAGRKDLSIKDGSIETAHLSFAYAEQDEEVLHDIEVKFPSKNMTAIVGGSGSGKSTLVNLLLRFFDPSHGMIIVDGQNISEVRIHDLRGKVGIVSQDSTLFDGTVMDNILYGNEGKERGDAMRAARQAGAHDFIERLPGGYDAPVGPGGEYLSGGQRQRLAIARTLLREPQIIVFDEATSALDAESEYRIQDAISALRRTKTVIVIAHRLSTIKTADNILVLENGKFVEEGQFEDLIERRGAFYRFYWRQFGGLATFRQQMDLELERSARYGSKFCLAVLKVQSYEKIESAEGTDAAGKFMDGVDFLLKKSIRMGDNSAILDRDIILIILPEIDSDQLKLFFNRMISLMPRPAGTDLPYALAKEDLRFIGTRVSKRLFRTPEEILHALTDAANAMEPGLLSLVIDEEELAKRFGPGGKA